MPLSHQLVITRAVRAGIVMINAAIKSGAATTRMDLRNAITHASMATAVTQNAIVANVNGYGSMSRNRFGVHQSQYVVAASRTGSREHVIESSDRVGFMFAPCNSFACRPSPACRERPHSGIRTAIRSQLLLDDFRSFGHKCRLRDYCTVMSDRAFEIGIKHVTPKGQFWHLRLVFKIDPVKSTRYDESIL